MNSFSIFKYVILSSLSISLIISACKKDIFINQTDYKDEFKYYPMHIGASWNYEIDSMVFYKSINGLQIDTSHYLVKETIVDTFTSGGNLVYRIDKYERLTPQDPWNIKTVYSIQAEDNLVLKTEENQKFVKLTLPIQNGNRWDGNLYINKGNEIQIGGESIQLFKDWESKVISKDKPFNNGWMNFDSTATIEITNNETLIDVRNGYEIYAKNYGLINRYLRVLDTQCNGNPIDCKDLPWEVKADKGFIVKQKLTGFQW